MAKLFNQIYMETNQSVYSDKVHNLLAGLFEVPGVNFQPVLAPNGKVDGTTTKYNIQRRKRPTVNTVATTGASTTAIGLAELDQFTTIDWDTTEIATGTLESVGFKELLAEDFDFSNSPKHAKDLYYTINEVAVKRHKKLITLLETATPTGAALPAYVEGKTIVWDALSDQVITGADVDDEYMDIQAPEDFYIITDKTVAKELTHEMGQAFLQEAPIAQTGFHTGMSVNGTPVIVDYRLKGRATYVVHKNAISIGTQFVEDVRQQVGTKKFTGRFFFDVMALVDKARAFKFGT